MRSGASFLLAVLTAIGCSAGPGGGTGGSSAAGDPGGSGGAGGEIFPTGSGSGTGVGAGGPGCSEAAQLIYVLSEDNELYSFRPDQKQFTKLGPLSCPTSMFPNSMAVDRDAVAWVNYVEAGFDGDVAGEVFRVNTLDLGCEATGVTLTDGWYRMGMGYATLGGAGTTEERLYVTGTANPNTISPGLGYIDDGNSPVTPVGQFTGSLNGENAELTGTGDGRLFGFFTTTPVQVAQIEKETGAIINPVGLQGVETPTSWAFSFWGGDFYLYTAPGDASVTSNVTKYSPSDGSVDPFYMTNIGFRIVGAGVSTCAPLEPPE